MIVAAMTTAYGAHGLPLPEREVLLSVIGLSLIEAFTKLGDGDRTDSRLQVSPNTTGDAFHAMREPASADGAALSGCRGGGRRCSRGATMSLLGIATGKSQRGVRLVLGHHGLLDHFITIQTADDAPSKPDPGMVLDAMREAGVAAADTIVVGDTAYDIAMARAAGAAGIGVTWGYHPAASARRGGRARGDRRCSQPGADARPDLGNVTQGVASDFATLPPQQRIGLKIAARPRAKLA